MTEAEKKAEADKAFIQNDISPIFREYIEKEEFGDMRSFGKEFGLHLENELGAEAKERFKTLLNSEDDLNKAFTDLATSSLAGAGVAMRKYRAVAEKIFPGMTADITKETQGEFAELLAQYDEQLSVEGADTTKISVNKSRTQRKKNFVDAYLYVTNMSNYTLDGKLRKTLSKHSPIGKWVDRMAEPHRRAQKVKKRAGEGILGTLMPNLKEELDPEFEDKMNKKSSSWFIKAITGAVDAFNLPGNLVSAAIETTQALMEDPAYDNMGLYDVFVGNLALRDDERDELDLLLQEVGSFISPAKLGTKVVGKVAGPTLKAGTKLAGTGAKAVLIKSANIEKLMTKFSKVVGSGASAGEDVTKLLNEIKVVEKALEKAGDSIVKRGIIKYFKAPLGSVDGATVAKVLNSPLAQATKVAIKDTWFEDIVRTAYAFKDDSPQNGWFEVGSRIFGAGAEGYFRSFSRIPAARKAMAKQVVDSKWNLPSDIQKKAETIWESADGFKTEVGVPEAKEIMGVIKELKKKTAEEINQFLDGIELPVENFIKSLRASASAPQLTTAANSAQLRKAFMDEIDGIELHLKTLKESGSVDEFGNALIRTEESSMPMGSAKYSDVWLDVDVDIVGGQGIRDIKKGAQRPIAARGKKIDIDLTPEQQQVQDALAKSLNEILSEQVGKEGGEVAVKAWREINGAYKKSIDLEKLLIPQAKSRKLTDSNIDEIAETVLASIDKNITKRIKDGVVESLDITVITQKVIAEVEQSIKNSMKHNKIKGLEGEFLHDLDLTDILKLKRGVGDVQGDLYAAALENFDEVFLPALKEYNLGSNQLSKLKTEYLKMVDSAAKGSMSEVAQGLYSFGAGGRLKITDAFQEILETAVTDTMNKTKGKSAEVFNKFLNARLHKILRDQSKSLEQRAQVTVHALIEGSARFKDLMGATLRAGAKQTARAGARAPRVLGAEAGDATTVDDSRKDLPEGPKAKMTSLQQTAFNLAKQGTLPKPVISELRRGAMKAGSAPATLTVMFEVAKNYDTSKGSKVDFAKDLKRLGYLKNNKSKWEALANLVDDVRKEWGERGGAEKEVYRRLTEK